MKAINLRHITAVALRMKPCLFFAALLLALCAPVFPQVNISEEIPSANVTGILEYSGEVWVATYGQGIWRYTPATRVWESYSTQDGTAENDFFYCIAVNRQFIWAGSSDGLFIFDRTRKTWKKRKFALGGDYGNWIRSLCYDSLSNSLWIGRFKYLSRLDLATQKYDDYDLTVAGDPRTNTFKVIKVDPYGLIWFGTEGGVFAYDRSLNPSSKESYTFYSNRGNGFRGEGDHVSIADVLFEKQHVWFATDEFVTADQPDFNAGGLFRFNRRAGWELLNAKAGLQANGVKALARSGAKVWAGIYSFNPKSKKEDGKGIALIDKYKMRASFISVDDLKLASRLVTALHFDGLHLWIGTEAGLYRLPLYNAFAVFSPAAKKAKTVR